MRVVIAGGSGFLGRALTRSLQADGHQVSVLTRRARPGHPEDIAWTPNGQSGPWANALADAGAVVNLAGEGIADKRWTSARKQALVQSRLDATGSLVAALRALPAPRPALISGSGIGYYGSTGDARISEDAPAGRDFVATMATAWEAATGPAEAVTRVVRLRTGLVLGKEGALKKMLPPFRLGVGGHLGTGAQWMPWISVDDWVGLTSRLIADDGARGPFNLCAPEPVTNADFTTTLGTMLRRPTVFHVPAFALRLALGELSDVLLTGQRAMPDKAQALGYVFRQPALEQALRAALD